MLGAHPDLTLTGLYNLREKLVAGAALSDAEQDQRTRGRVGIIAELHDRIDAAVAEAEQIEALLPQAKAKKPSFPRDAIGQTAAVIAELRGGAALSAEAIARRYAQGRKVERRIAATLSALERLGHVVSEGEDYRLRKAA